MQKRKYNFIVHDYYKAIWQQYNSIENKHKTAFGSMISKLTFEMEQIRELNQQRTVQFMTSENKIISN